MTSITVIVLNYGRVENLPGILDALWDQIEKPEIWVWNNTGEPIVDPRIGRQVLAFDNYLCWPRWFLATYVSTEFVMMLDDDLTPVARTFTEVAIGALEAETAVGTIVGTEGVVLGVEGDYWPRYEGRIARPHANGESGTVHLKSVSSDCRVDIVKGRCLAVRAEALARLPMRPAHRDTSDDIAVSAILAQGRRRMHLVSAALGNCVKDIEDKLELMALSKRPGWRENRESARSHYFS